MSELTQLKKLQKELAELSFDHVFTSDLRRCLETLAYLNVPAQVSVDTRIREINFGDWEGKTYNELKDNQIYRDWLNNWENLSIPNGESADTFKARIDTFIQDLLQHPFESTPNEKKLFLIMTHGGVIRYIVSKFVPSIAFWELSVPHGHGIHLTLVKHKGEWACNSLSVVPFQEKEK